MCERERYIEKESERESEREIFRERESINVGARNFRFSEFILVNRFFRTIHFWNS